MFLLSVKEFVVSKKLEGLRKRGTFAKAWSWLFRTIPGVGIVVCSW